MAVFTVTRTRIGSVDGLSFIAPDMAEATRLIATEVFDSIQDILDAQMRTWTDIPLVMDGHLYAAHCLDVLRPYHAMTVEVPGYLVALSSSNPTSAETFGILPP